MEEKGDVVTGCTEKVARCCTHSTGENSPRNFPMTEKDTISVVR